jgi:hypothetical protein
VEALWGLSKCRRMDPSSAGVQLNAAAGGRQSCARSRACGHLLPVSQPATPPYIHGSHMHPRHGAILILMSLLLYLTLSFCLSPSPRLLQVWEASPQAGETPFLDALWAALDEVRAAAAAQRSCFHHKSSLDATWAWPAGFQLCWDGQERDQGTPAAATAHDRAFTTTTTSWSSRSRQQTAAAAGGGINACLPVEAATAAAGARGA